MIMYRLHSIALAAAVAIGALAGTASVHANSVDAVLKVSQQKTEAARNSQQKIDGIASETRELLQEYQSVNKQIDGLRVYNQRLENQISNQMRRVTDIEESIEQVTVIQRQIMPLVIRMIDGLEQFVEMDVPFLIDERQQRLEFLRNNIDRSDLSVAEKFRQVLEAYKIELEYGRKIDAYKGTVAIGGVDREVNFLRIGRIALLYQTTDTDVAGAWSQEQGEWVSLDAGTYRNALMKGLRIARKQASIEIMKTPVPAPEAANQ